VRVFSPVFALENDHLSSAIFIKTIGNKPVRGRGVRGKVYTNKIYRERKGGKEGRINGNL